MLVCDLRCERVKEKATYINKTASRLSGVNECSDLGTKCSFQLSDNVFEEHSTG